MEAVPGHPKTVVHVAATTEVIGNHRRHALQALQEGLAAEIRMAMMIVADMTQRPVAVVVGKIIKAKKP